MSGPHLRATRGAADGLFRREARADFRHVGAVAPSGRALAAALAAVVTEARAEPRRFLEVGAGTGAVTEAMVPRLGPGDSLVVVERNAAFAAHLRGRLRNEPAFEVARDRVRIVETNVETLRGDAGFHAIVSSLPFNNFAAAEVAAHLDHFTGMLVPCGRLAFFEYLWVRGIRRVVSGRAERSRLAGVGRAIAAVLARTESSSRIVWRNVPPALVHELRVGGP